MLDFIYRCPATNYNVQGSVKDDWPKVEEYAAMTCLACGQVHWVNPLNGKLRAEEQRVPHGLQ